MGNVVNIHQGKQPRRPHFIAEWSEKRGLSQSDLARELNVDKSIVSRWFSGSSPSEKSQIALAALFSCEPDSLFRHPDEDWMARFFKRLSQQEIDRAKLALELMFPRAS